MLADDRRVAAGNDIDTPVMRKECRATPPVDVASAALSAFRNYSEVELCAKLEAVNLEVMWVRGWGWPFYSPMVRTVSEWLPNGPPVGELSRSERRAARVLHQLYRLNVAGRGDVITALARI